MAILIPGILILLLTVPYLKIHIAVSAEGKKDQIYLRIRLGFLNNRLHYEINRKSHIRLPFSFPEAESEHDFNVQHTILQKIKNTLEKLPGTRYQIESSRLILQKALRHILIEDLEWESTIGLEDASTTGIISGSLWAFKGSLLSILSSFSRIKNFTINVQPDFTSMAAHSRLSCILKIRIVHIIFIAGYATYLFVRGYINGYAATIKRKQPSH